MNQVASVAEAAAGYGIDVLTPDDPNTSSVLARVRDCSPDFLFSFYYRRMLGTPLLACAGRGAFNMHGSLLPRYRGRAPVNWALIHGETETGATLHAMVDKPDAGAIVDQLAVPILPDDTAADVFGKVTVAAELVRWRSLPGLIEGSIRPQPQDLRQGRYFGGRKPEDGRIDPRWSAARVHDFVRALTRPFPGAFFDLPQGRLQLWQTRHAGRTHLPPAVASLALADGQLCLACADGGLLRVTQASIGGEAFTADAFARRFPASVVVMDRR